MTRYLTSNFFLTIFFFIFLRFVDANLILKGSFFIIISLLLIYIPQKNLDKKNLLLLIIFFLFFLFLNEKKEITEFSAPLKLDQNNSIFYEETLGQKKYLFLKKNYLKYSQDCFVNNLNCFQNDKISETYLSPDQLFLNSDKTISRKLSEIKFTSLANSRMAFVNSNTGNINHENLFKLDTPFYVEYRNIENLDSICFKGIAFIETLDGEEIEKDHEEFKCISKKLKSITGFNLPNKNLEILSNEKKISKYLDDFMLVLFTIFIIINLNKKSIVFNQIKLLIPVLLSTFIIFYISRFDSWFNVFNLFNFYFFGFEGGDGNKYINFVNLMLNNLYNYNFIEVLRGAEDVYHYTPGLRYFLLLNNLISGDFYYFYFFLLFFLPKIIYKFSVNQFGEKIGYLFTISFLLVPILHHLGFSYYQFIRHAYRLYPESLGYMFFLSGLYIHFTTFKKNYLKMNLLFAISVFLRPNLVVSIFLIVLIRTIKERLNIFSYKYFFPLLFISLIYFFPLIHNLYFGNSFTLFTEYGSKILSFGTIDHDNPRYNILSNDLNFYLDKIFSLNFLFLTLILIPKTNLYLKIILLTQYLTIFYFDENSRYYWIYYFASINLIYESINIYIFNRWKSLKNYI